MHFFNDVEITAQQTDYYFESDNRFRSAKYGTNYQLNLSESN